MRHVCSSSTKRKRSRSTEFAAVEVIGKIIATGCIGTGNHQLPIYIPNAVTWTGKVCKKHSFCRTLHIIVQQFVQLGGRVTERHKNAAVWEICHITVVQ